MRTCEDGYSIVDRLIFEQKRDVGIDVARAPGFVWLKGEDDERESTADFIARVRKEAAAAGFPVVEISGCIGTED